MPVAVLPVHIGAPGDQDPRDLRVLVLEGGDQRGCAVAVLNRRPQVQQPSDEFAVTLRGRTDQQGSALQQTARVPLAIDLDTWAAEGLDQGFLALHRRQDQGIPRVLGQGGGVGPLGEQRPNDRAVAGAHGRGQRVGGRRRAPPEQRRDGLAPAAVDRTHQGGAGLGVGTLVEQEPSQRGVAARGVGQDGLPPGGFDIGIGTPLQQEAHGLEVTLSHRAHQCRLAPAVPRIDRRTPFEQGAREVAPGARGGRALPLGSPRQVGLHGQEQRGLTRAALGLGVGPLGEQQLQDRLVAAAGGVAQGHGTGRAVRLDTPGEHGLHQRQVAITGRTGQDLLLPQPRDAGSVVSSSRAVTSAGSPRRRAIRQVSALGAGGAVRPASA